MSSPGSRGRARSSLRGRAQARGCERCAKMVVQISAQSGAGTVARPGLLRKTATETAEAEASGGFFSWLRGAGRLRCWL